MKIGSTVVYGIWTRVTQIDNQQNKWNALINNLVTLMLMMKCLKLKTNKYFTTIAMFSLQRIWRRRVILMVFAYGTFNILIVSCGDYVRAILEHDKQINNNLIIQCALFTIISSVLHLKHTPCVTGMTSYVYCCCKHGARSCTILVRI